MNVAEKRLRDYPKYKNEILKRKWELSYTERDINASIRSIGKNSNPIEATVISYEMDLYIRNREFWIKCVEDTLKELDEFQLMVVKEYYFENVYNYRDLARKHRTNKNTIMKSCQRAKNILSEKLGEI